MEGGPGGSSVGFRRQPMEASGGSPAPAREWRERTAVQSGKFGGKFVSTASETRQRKTKTITDSKKIREM